MTWWHDCDVTLLHIEMKLSHVEMTCHDDMTVTRRCDVTWWHDSDMTLHDVTWRIRTCTWQLKSSALCVTWLVHMSHIQMSHGTSANESRHTYNWVMSRMWECRVIRTSHVTHRYESRHTCEWVTSQVKLSYVTDVNESCHMNETWVMSRHTSHFARTIESRHGCEWVTSYEWVMTRHTCGWVMLFEWIMSYECGM